MHRYLVVSDLHLCDVEEHADGWKAYKSARHVFDPDFERLVVRALDSLPADASFTLVLNGDILDFDLVCAVPDAPPWPVNRAERLSGMEATGPKSAWKCQRVLDHHPVFVRTLARVLCSGHGVVIVMGNHDREFHFPEVQQVVVDELLATVKAGGGTCDTAAIRFEPWFFYRPGEIYAEHGNQYDYYSSFRFLLHPTVRIADEERLALPMGNLSNRQLMTRMGYFNPHSTDYIQNIFSYAAHWLRFYAFSRRGIVMPWFLGSIKVMARLLRGKKLLLKPPEGYDDRLQRVATDNRIADVTVTALTNLQRPPITYRFYRIVREFWIDRLLISLLMIGGTVTLALVPIPLWIQLMVPLTCFPLVFFVYERAVHGEDVFTVDRQLPQYARSIANLLPVHVVTMGHTHRPTLVPLSRGVAFVNTGTWASVSRWTDRNEPPGYRNYLLADFEDGRDPTVTLDSWHTIGTPTNGDVEPVGKAPTTPAL
jgi:UDP-2,3-diacylglucosamine pyrophosphatase LpxH